MGFYPDYYISRVLIYSYRSEEQKIVSCVTIMNVEMQYIYTHDSNLYNFLRQNLFQCNIYIGSMVP